MILSILVFIIKWLLILTGISYVGGLISESLHLINLGIGYIIAYFFVLMIGTFLLFLFLNALNITTISFITIFKEKDWPKKLIALTIFLIFSTLISSLIYGLIFDCFHLIISYIAVITVSIIPLAFTIFGILIIIYILAYLCIYLYYKFGLLAIILIMGFVTLISYIITSGNIHNFTAYIAVVITGFLPTIFILVIGVTIIYFTVSIIYTILSKCFLFVINIIDNLYFWYLHRKKTKEQETKRINEILSQIEKKKKIKY